MADALRGNKLRDEKLMGAYKSAMEKIQEFQARADNKIRATSASPENVICMNGLCMDKTEVTESAYAQEKGKSPSSNGLNMPVTMVSVHDARDYCERMGKRLPMLDEWMQFACIGSNRMVTIDNQANIDSSGIMEVGSLEPNCHGMFDMIGNVWEWVADSGVNDDAFPYSLQAGFAWLTSPSEVNAPYSSLDREPPDSNYNPDVIFPSRLGPDIGFRCIWSPNPPNPSRYNRNPFQIHPERLIESSD